MWVGVPGGWAGRRGLTARAPHRTAPPHPLHPLLVRVMLVVLRGEEWLPQRHPNYPATFRAAVRTLLLVAERGRRLALAAARRAGASCAA